MLFRALMVAYLFSAPVFAGGAWLSLDDPKTNADLLAVGALATVGDYRLVRAGIPMSSTQTVYVRVWILSPSGV